MCNDSCAFNTVWCLWYDIVLMHSAYRPWGIYTIRPSQVMKKIIPGVSLKLYCFIKAHSRRFIFTLWLLYVPSARMSWRGLGAWSMEHGAWVLPPRAAGSLATFSPRTQDALCASLGKPLIFCLSPPQTALLTVPAHWVPGKVPRAKDANAEPALTPGGRQSCSVVSEKYNTSHRLTGHSLASACRVELLWTPHCIHRHLIRMPGTMVTFDGFGVSRVPLGVSIS